MTSSAELRAEALRIGAELRADIPERKAADAAKARDRHQAETSRAVTAEKLLAEARERLLARIIEIDAVRQRVAQANAVTNAAYDPVLGEEGLIMDGLSEIESGLF
jgi:hypothetical protein